MTTFHSENSVDVSTLKVIGAGSNDPDAIGFEVEHDGREIFTIYFEATGRRSIRFTMPPDIEFDADQFRSFIENAFGELEVWETNLRLEHGAWSDACLGRGE